MKNASVEATRQAQRKYRLKQRTKLEDYKQEVENLQSRLSELDLKRAGLASQNKILEETAAAVEARNQKDAVAVSVEKQKLWDERTGKCLAEFVNNVRAESLIVELSAEEGRRLNTSEILLLLKEFYRQVTDILGSTAPETVKSRHLNRLITAKGEMRRALEFMGPRFASILALGLETAQKPPANSIVPGFEAARRGLDVLCLSEEQKQELLTGRNRLLRRYGDIKQERIEIVQRMHEAIERERAEGDQQSSAMMLLEEVNAMDELRRNLDQEHTCFFRFQAEIHDTLSTIQFAKALAMKQMDQVSIWTLMQLLAAQEAAKRGLILINCPAVAYEGLTLAPQNGHSQPQPAGGSAAAPSSTPAPQLGQAYGTAQQMYGLPAAGGSGNLLPGFDPRNPPACQPEPNAGPTNAFQHPFTQTSYQPGEGHSQVEQPPALGPDSTYGTESHHSPTEQDFEMMDDLLLDMPDPFGLDFASASAGEGGPLWKMAQDLSSGQAGGSERQIPLQHT